MVQTGKVLVMTLTTVLIQEQPRSVH